MLTKTQAIDVLVKADNPRSPGFTVSEAVRALADAGAFPSEATLAEIADVATVILTAEHGGSINDPESWALRLASACRAAGLVKP